MLAQILTGVSIWGIKEGYSSRKGKTIGAEKGSVVARCFGGWGVGRVVSKKFHYEMER